MARQVRNVKTDSRTARAKLAQRREPYWTTITTGAALGYRKGSKAGTWVGRYRDEDGQRHYEALGAADDFLDANGSSCLDFAQAQTAARTWFDRKEREILTGGPVTDTGPYTVSDAARNYLKAYVAGRTLKGNARRGAELEKSIDTHIVQTLGTVPLRKLSKARIEKWLSDIADRPARLRSSKGGKQNYRPSDKSPDAIRQRRSSANRILSNLKALLNLAYAEGRVDTDDAWRRVKPYRQADAARTRYLSDDEARRLVNAACAEFRPMLLAALHTGCRYGELCALVREDYAPDSGTLFVRVSKSGKPRHVVLTDEGQRFFARIAAGVKPGCLLLTRASGTAWGKSHQTRFMTDAVKAARIAAVSFHELRHTYASKLVSKGAPMAVVAAQLGHTDTRMVEKHYAHMAPNFVADTVRALLGNWNAETDVDHSFVMLKGGR